MSRLPKAISVDHLTRIKFVIIRFIGRFKASFGNPQLGGVWLIWGNSSNGKTSLAMQIAKEIATNFAKVAYNSYEEGISMSFQNTIIRNRMSDCGKQFIILAGEELETLIERLRKRNAPRVVIIDSVQHLQLKKTEYRSLKEEFPQVLFIFISHAKGKQPKGEVADFIKYDADLKIWVEGYRAFVSGRLNNDEGEYFDIYPEKSKIYWNDVA